MKIRDLFEKWGLSTLKVKTPFLDMEWKPNDSDRNAAWELYVELLTRITTQPLLNDHGSENAALSSIHSLFETTRTILKENGAGCIQFSRIAIVVLNQIIRPFTAKWHIRSLNDAFDSADQCVEFRAELQVLQQQLRKYTALLSELADVEDLSSL